MQLLANCKERVKNESTDLTKVLFVISHHVLPSEYKLSCCCKILIHFASPSNLIVLGICKTCPSPYLALFPLTLTTAEFDWLLEGNRSQFSVQSKFPFRQMFHNLCIFQNSRSIIIYCILKFWISLKIFSDDRFLVTHVGMITFNMRFSFKRIKKNDQNFVRNREI